MQLGLSSELSLKLAEGKRSIPTLDTDRTDQDELYTKNSNQSNQCLFIFPAADSSK